MQYWLMKSEPDAYSIDDLVKAAKQQGHWDGVRNYQARNMLREQMRKGDLAFFYHSSCKEPGIVGIVEIIKEGYPDPTAFDKRSKYYDPQSNPAQPRWFMVDIKLVRKLSRVITLHELKALPALHDMQLLKKGNRLSIMPVTKVQWDIILKLEK